MVILLFLWLTSGVTAYVSLYFTEDLKKLPFNQVLIAALCGFFAVFVAVVSLLLLVINIIVSGVKLYFGLD